MSGLSGFADDDRLRRGDVALEQLVLRGLLHEQARARAAILAAVLEHGERRQAAGLLQVGVREHDAGALAAELERDALDRAGRLARDLDADLGRAGEADLADERMLDERVADGAAGAGDDVEHAGGQARLEPELRVAQGREGGEAGGLEHHGVAGGDRRRRLPVADVEREVPRRDQGGDADRLAEGEHDAVAVDGDGGAEELVHGAGVVAHHGGRVAGAPAGVADRHAHVARLEQPQLVDVLLEQVGPAVEHLGALDRRARPPVGERPRRRLHGAVGVLAPRLRDGAEHLAGGGVDGLERASLGGRDALAVDHQAFERGAHSVSFDGLGGSAAILAPARRRAARNTPAPARTAPIVPSSSSPRVSV